MREHLSTRTLHTLLCWTAILCVVSAIAGCRARLEGSYENAEMSIVFTSRHASVTTPGGTVEVDYTVHGDKVVLHNQAGDVVLTFTPDGSLDGPLGRLKKK